MKFKIKDTLALICCIAIQYGQAQDIKIHSHNDYYQSVPFWNAFGNGLNSIEVDIFLKNDTLYATHGEAEIRPNRTMENLYLQPIQTAISLELDGPKELQLLVDIKSESRSTLENLVSLLQNYPDIIANRNLSLVISGNRPPPREYINYPDYILFDYQSLEDAGDPEIWKKIALISLDFKGYSPWNGKGRLTARDYNVVKAAVEKAHSYGKPFRFWATPDSKSAWKAFTDLGIDFINTDKPFEASTYLKTLPDRVYYNTISSEVYNPTYVTDQKTAPVQNVILLIGDGNGLTQISSSVLASGGQLTLTQLKSIGFLKTQSADDFTTDSAAAGTALATGKKTNNRAIGLDASGQPLENITELLSEHDYETGCITTDKITGATPAAFYAHTNDRSEVEQIAADLVKSKLSLFVGGGATDFPNPQMLSGFSMLSSLDALGQNRDARVGHFLADKEVPGVLEGRVNALAEAVTNGLEFLYAKARPFFLVVEGAQIDSYSHLNKVAGIVSEGIDFDRAVTEAVKFADKTGNTLVIVTADHETSGFSIPQGNMDKQMIEGDFTTDDHTGVMVPIFAYGPHSQEFQGVYENSEVFGKILKVLQIKRD